MSGLRARIRAGEVVCGTFVKTPAPQVVEILGLAGLDFAVSDMEHAPIGVDTLDGLAMAARGVNLPLLVRSTGAEAPSIWPALDLGCSGVMVPHVRSRDDAERVADAVRYGRGKRGFSPSGRAGAYGTVDAAAYRERMDAQNVILAQIEDVAALESLDEIAAAEDVDVLFVGPADLSLAMGVAPGSPELGAAIDRVVAAARKAGKATGLFIGAEAPIEPWVTRGVTVFVCGSDQALLMQGARRLALAAGKHGKE